MAKKLDLPVNERAESALLGAILRSEHAFWSIYDRVRSDHFNKPLYRQIFTAISDICTEGTRLSLTVLTARLPVEDEESGQDMMGVLTSLMFNAEGLDALDFADEVSECAGRRQIIQIAEKMSKSARSGDRPSIDVAGAD